jgi:hypothetical protein
MLSTKELIKLLHTPLHQLRLANVLVEGHISQGHLSFLDLKQSSFYTIFNYKLDGRDRSSLAKPVLGCRINLRLRNNDRPLTMRSTA